MGIKLNDVMLARDYCLESSDGLDEDDVVGYLAVLKRIAQIGGVTPDEKEFEKVLISYLSVDEGAVRKAQQLAGDKSTSLETLVSKIDDPGFRVCLLRDAYRMALEDAEVSKAERKAFFEIAEVLELSTDLANKIVDLVESEAKLLYEFAEIVKKESEKKE